MLIIKNLIKYFDNWIIIDYLNLEILDGKILMIVGFLGGGKIILFCCLVGLEIIDFGEFLLDGVFFNFVEMDNVD